MTVSVGIGLTNDCNLRCAHCYRDPGAEAYLSLEDVQLIYERLQPASFNLGTGENYLHPQFHIIIQFLSARGAKMSMASNGYSILAMSDAELRSFHDVEVSVDFATPEQQDAFRGRGNWGAVMSAIERCHLLDVEVTILATLMSVNYDRTDELARLAADVGANLRVNAYQPVQNGAFTLSYAQFWEGYRRLLSASRLVSTSEPVLNAVLSIDDLGGSPCGHQSIRITPHREIIPCVYWPGRELSLLDLPRLDERKVLESEQFRRSHLVPNDCQTCPHVHSCGGGCASRRALMGALDQPDPYCPYPRGDGMTLEYSAAPSKDLPRGRNVCTTIVTQ